jgi:hypothetical protein
MDEEEWASVESVLGKMLIGAQCQTALHRSEYHRYSTLSSCFSLPQIVLSALSASGQLYSKSLEPGVEQLVITCTAGVSLFCAILGSISNYLKLESKKASHEVCCNAWLLFHDRLSTLLGTARGLRTPTPKEALDNAMAEYTRLYENSPIVAPGAIKAVKKRIRAFAPQAFRSHVPVFLNGWSVANVWGVDADDFSDNSV